MISPEVVYCTLRGYPQVTPCLRAGLDFKYNRSIKIGPVRLFNGVFRLFNGVFLHYVESNALATTE